MFYVGVPLCEDETFFDVQVIWTLIVLYQLQDLG